MLYRKSTWVMYYRGCLVRLLVDKLHLEQVFTFGIYYFTNSCTNVYIYMYYISFYKQVSKVPVV